MKIKIILLLSFVALTAIRANATNDTDQASATFIVSNVEEFILKAKNKRLAESRFWQVLLHYRAGFLGELESEADAVDFFLAGPIGKSDPKEELRATIYSFFKEPIPDQLEDHALCRFPARYKWLQKELGLFSPYEASIRCTEFEKWRTVMDAGSLSIVFASAYLNAPPSMYGHTFLMITRKSTPDVELLAHIVNYAASPTTDNPIFYTLLGIFGGFKGRFAAMPFYVKLQEYSNVESRDLWRYELNLSDDQLDWVVRHLWELDQTYFDYFFFDENCSYHLLSVLEMVWPEIHLREQFDLFTIPTNTLRSVMENPAALKTRSFRPSHVRHMHAAYQLLDNNEIDLAEELAIGDQSKAINQLKTLSPERQARVLDAGLLYFKYKHGFNPGEDTMQPEALKQREHRLVFKRSTLDVKVNAPIVKEPPAPEDGHKTTRLELAVGLQRNGPVYEEIAIRPSYHDLLDRQLGYVPDSSLEMFSLRLRTLPHRLVKEGRQTQSVFLEHLDLIRVVSLTPLEGWVRQLSWRARGAYRRVPDLPCMSWRCTAIDVEGGPGIAVTSHLLKREVTYVFADSSFEFGPAFEHKYRLRLGVAAGLLLQLTDWWRFHGEAMYRYAYLGDKEKRPVLHVQLGMGIALSQNVALRLHGVRYPDVQEAKLSFMVYW